MKKKIITGLLSVALILTCFANVSAFDQWSYSEDLTVYVNGTVVDNGQYKPIIVNDRTLVRLVPVFEAMGFTNYSYDDATKTVVFMSPTSNVGYQFTAENNEAIALNSEGGIARTVQLEVPATLQYYDVFYMPIRAFCEMTGQSIYWDANTRTVYINGGADGSDSSANVSNASLIGDYIAYVDNEGMASLSITDAGSGNINFAYSRRHDANNAYTSGPATLQSDGSYVATGEVVEADKASGVTAKIALKYVITPMANGNISYAMYDINTGNPYDNVWEFVKQNSGSADSTVNALLTYEEAKAKGDAYVNDSDIFLSGSGELIVYNGRSAYQFKLYSNSMAANGGSGYMGEILYVYADNGEVALIEGANTGTSSNIKDVVIPGGNQTQIGMEYFCCGKIVGKSTVEEYTQGQHTYEDIVAISDEYLVHAADYKTSNGLKPQKALDLVSTAFGQLEYGVVNIYSDYIDVIAGDGVKSDSGYTNFRISYHPNGSEWAWTKNVPCYELMASVSDAFDEEYTTGVALDENNNVIGEAN